MTEEETIKDMHFQQIDEECSVDLSEDITFPSIALSYKQHAYQTNKGLKLVLEIKNINRIDQLYNYIKFLTKDSLSL